MSPDEPATTSASRALQAARQRRLGLRRCLGEVEAALAAPAAHRGQEWAAPLAEALERLQESFELHVQVTEGQGGLFEDILERAPRLDNLVARLRREHLPIARAIDGALAMVGEAQADGDPEPLRGRVLGVLGLISRHRQHGADLVFEAYQVDIGGET